MLAASLDPGLVILEGSGAAIPPVPWDAGILVVPSSAPPEYLAGYLGPYRLLRSDVVVVTMSGDPSGSENLSELRSPVRRYLDDAAFIVAELLPVPLPAGDADSRPTRRGIHIDGAIVVGEILLGKTRRNAVGFPGQN